MTFPTTWTASTAAEARNILRAAIDRLDSAVRAAHPDLDAVDRWEKAGSTHVGLDLNFSFAELETTAEDRSTRIRLTRG